MPTLRESGPNISVLNLPPVFNKRLFKAQAGIVLTDDTLEILQRRSTARRSAEELHVIKPVVAALKEIHKGLQFIKEALCHVVTYQKIEAGVEISKQKGESCLSCYYILSGSVEAKYDINNGSSGDPAAAEKSYDCEITYTHVAGEYLGLVSGDGREFDLPPPDSIRSAEVTEFLRVDRDRFHSSVKRVQNRYVQEIEMFIEEVAALKALPSEEKRKLVGLMARQVSNDFTNFGYFYIYFDYKFSFPQFFFAFEFICVNFWLIAMFNFSCQAISLRSQNRLGKPLSI